MKKIILFTVLALCGCNVIFGQVVCKSSPTTRTDADAEKKMPEFIGLVDQLAPSFTSVDVDGIEYKLESLRGKVVVINLWGTFCAPCIAEMPNLNALVEKYKGKDVVFLAPTPDDKSLLDGFLKKNPFNYQVFPNSMPIIKQYAPRKKVSSPTDKPGGFIMLLPAHLVVDREVRDVKHLFGYKSDSLIDDLTLSIDESLSSK